MRRNMIRFSKLLASLALMITSLNINTACLFIAHQPRLPEEANKLRKF